MQTSKPVPRFKAMVVGTGCALLLGIACAKSGRTGGAQASSAHRVAIAPSATSRLSRAAPVEWRAALRVQQWRVAADAFDAENPGGGPPKLRYARARMASELGNHKHVLSLLVALEHDLPSFADEIKEQRARSQVVVGPYDLGAAFFAGRDDIRSMQVRAQALERNGDLQQAGRILDAAIQRSGSNKKKTLHAELRRARAEVNVRRGRPQKARQDFEWLALKVPTQLAAQGADVELERLRGSRLTKGERFGRAEYFTEAGNFSGASAEFRALTGAPGPAPTGVSVLRTQAWSHYKSRNDYQRAAALFRQCAELDPRHRVQDLFYSARALSRAHDHSGAISAYQSLAKSYPRSSYAEQSHYLAARLHYISGEWKAATLAYRDYLKRYSHGKKGPRYQVEVRYEQMLTRLALGQGKQVLKSFAAIKKSKKSERLKALVTELEGVAYMQAGEPARAMELWRGVMASQPLSFAALMSAARLESLGEPQPVHLAASKESELEKTAPLGLLLPAKVKTLLGLGLDLDAEAELRHQRSAFKAAHAPRGGEAICMAYGQMSTAAAGYSYAQAIVRQRVLQRAMTPATRWLWECIYPRPYSEFVREIEREFSIPTGLTHALMRQESGFRSTIKSPVGATGLMQLMPNTARRVSAELQQTFRDGSLLSPAVNIRYGGYYLSKMLKTFGGNMALAAAAYNAGPMATKRWLIGAQGLPLDIFVARIPYRETRHYVSRVVGNWARYRYLQNGAGADLRLSLALPPPVAPLKSDY